MASRRDLFQSYQFMVQRVISGVVLRETDPIQTPLRKMIGSGFASVMIAVVALAGTGLIGIFFGGTNTQWQDGGAIIVEEESGARFVWLPDEDGRELLYPTANFASAALLVGGTEIVGVSHASLLEVPRGPRLGIADAPDSLPVPELMLGAPWTLCSLPTQTISGERIPNTALVVGSNITEGDQTGDAAVLVKDIERGTLHMVWNGHQYPIPNPEPVLEGLTLRTVPQVEVGTAWLNALPSGLDLVPVPVAERGAPSTAFPGAISGEVRYVESADDKQYYQVAAQQIVEITEVQALILLADPLIRNTAYAGRTPEALLLSAAEANLAQRVELTEAAPTDPPADQPARAEITEQEPTICASFEADQATPQIAVDAAVQGAEKANTTQRVTEAGTVLADRVLVEPGYGTIVEGMASSTAEAGTRYLVTDEGRSYPLPSEEVQKRLGYGDFQPIALPASLIARVPSGAALDPLAARQQVG